MLWSFLFYKSVFTVPIRVILIHFFQLYFLACRLCWCLLHWLWTWCCDVSVGLAIGVVVPLLKFQTLSFSAWDDSNLFVVCSVKTSIKWIFLYFNLCEVYCYTNVSISFFLYFNLYQVYCYTYESSVSQLLSAIV